MIKINIPVKYYDAPQEEKLEVVWQHITNLQISWKLICNTIKFDPLDLQIYNNHLKKLSDKSDKGLSEADILGAFYMLHKELPNADEIFSENDYHIFKSKFIDQEIVITKQFSTLNKQYNNKYLYLRDEIQSWMNIALNTNPTNIDTNLELIKLQDYKNQLQEIKNSLSDCHNSTYQLLLRPKSDFQKNLQLIEKMLLQ